MTKLVSEACTRHKTAPTASAALGRCLTGTLLLAGFRKSGEVTQVSFKGNGDIGSVMAIADESGMVKGRLDNPDADPPLRDDGKLNVGAAIGQGVLSVIRSYPNPDINKPYTGLVPIVSGEIAEDLANYLVDSEQTNSALGLGVSLNRDCSVRSAGGFLVQILPFCSEETLTTLEQNLAALPSMTQMLNKGLSADNITDLILKGLVGELPPDRIYLTPKYGPCDSEGLRDRMMRAVAMLGENEVRDIMRTEGKIEVTCEFCNEVSNFKEEDILQLIGAGNL